MGKKAASAVSIYMKANNVKLALEETKVTLEDAAETVERMGTKLLHAHDYFLTGLPAFLQCFEGDNFDACAAKADFSDAVSEVESLADELDDLLGISRSVVTVMRTIRSIADDANGFSEGLFDFDFDLLLVPVENEVERAVKSIDHLVSSVRQKCSKAKTAVELLVSNSGKEYAKKKAEEIFGDLGPYVNDFELAYSNVVKPLMLALAQGVEGALKAARRLHLPVEAPESVADETIDSAKCSWRQTRWFKSIEYYNVDIEKTMVCDTGKTLGRWFKCWCVTTNDCYVSNKHRPEPVDSRRCFKRV